MMFFRSEEIKESDLQFFPPFSVNLRCFDFSFFKRGGNMSKSCGYCEASSMVEAIVISAHGHFVACRYLLSKVVLLARLVQLSP